MELGTAQSWFSKKTKSGGMLVEHVSHWIDQFRWWSGEVESVFAHTKTTLEHVDIEDNVSLVMKFRNGAIANITQSWSSYLPWNDLGVVGEKGSAEMLGPKYEKLRVRTRGQPTEEITLTETNNRYKREIEHFVHCVSEDKTPIISGYDGRAA